MSVEIHLGLSVCHSFPLATGRIPSGMGALLTHYQAKQFREFLNDQLYGRQGRWQYYFEILWLGLKKMFLCFCFTLGKSNSTFYNLPWKKEKLKRGRTGEIQRETWLLSSSLWGIIFCASTGQSKVQGQAGGNACKDKPGAILHGFLQAVKNANAIFKVCLHMGANLGRSTV